MSKNVSQIKATFAIVKASLISMLKNPSSLVFGLIFPLVFIIIFGLIGGDGSSVSIYLTEKTDKNTAIYEILDNIKSIKFEKYESDEKALEELGIGRVGAILDIQQAEGSQKTDIKLTTSEASAQSGQLIASIINGTINTINLSTVNTDQLPLTLEQETITGREYKAIDFILPGQLGFALLSSGVFSTAFVLINLKDTLVIKRFFATPIKKSNILIAEGISRLIYAILQAVIIIAVGYFFFDFTIINGLSTFLQMILVSTAGLIVFLGMGFFVSTIAKELNGVPAIANLFTLPQFLLAGTFFSIDLFPKWLQPISRALPLTHLNDSLRLIAFEGANISEVLPHLGVLAIWAIVIYAITARFFSWEK